jgi:hypothetical protein
VKSCALVAAILLTGFTTGSGKTYKIPPEHGVASIDVPSGWKATEYDRGVELTSDDGDVYMAIESTTTHGVEKSIEEAVRYLKGKGVSVESGSQKSREMKVNEMSSFLVSWDGHDKDGPARIQLLVIDVDGDRGVLVVYWASLPGEKKHQNEITNITQSLKKV